MLRFEMYQPKLFQAIINPDQELRRISPVGARSVAWSHRAKTLAYICAESGTGYHFAQGVESKCGAFSGRLASLTYDGCNRLLGCDLDDGCVVRYHDGVRQSFAERLEGAALKPRAVAVHSCGVLYVSTVSGIFFVMPENFALVKASGNIPMDPYALCLSASEDRLFFADRATGNVGMLDFLPDGTFSRALNLCFASEFPGGFPADIKTDRLGRVYVAAPSAVYIFDKAGLRIGNVRLPSDPSALCFGGEEMDALFIAAADGIYSLNIRY